MLVDGELAHDQFILTTPNAAFTLLDHEEVLNWLRTTASELNIGHGCCWKITPQSIISNIKCYVNPPESQSDDTKSSITKDEVVLDSTSYLQSMNNPFYGKDFEKLYVRYVINRNEDSNKDGFGGLFSFYNTAKNGSVSFQSAPYICYNTADGFWFDSNHPFTEESTNMAPYMEAGQDYTIDLILWAKDYD